MHSTHESPQPPTYLHQAPTFKSNDNPAEGKDNVNEESDDEVVLIEEQNFLFSVTVLIFRDREATSSPCLFVYIAGYAAAYI